MNAHPVLLQKKYARVILLYAQKYHLTPQKAMELFYRSELYQLVSAGVSNLHCMSDDYLTEELHDEWMEKENSEKNHEPFSGLKIC